MYRAVLFGHFVYPSLPNTPTNLLTIQAQKKKKKNILNFLAFVHMHISHTIQPILAIDSSTHYRPATTIPIHIKSASKRVTWRCCDCEDTI